MSDDLAALLAGARERVPTARATLRLAQDPAATLRAWSTAGPWQDVAAAGDPAAFGLPADPVEELSRQWIDRAADRAREERGTLVLVRDGPRWWREHPGIGPDSGEAPGSTIEVAEALDRLTDPAPLVSVLELSAAGSSTALGRPAVRAEARALGDGFDLALTPLGWGAARWELLVDAELGMLLAVSALTADGVAFRHVEAVELAVGEPLDDTLFAMQA